MRSLDRYDLDDPIDEAIVVELGSTEPRWLAPLLGTLFVASMAAQAVGIITIGRWIFEAIG